MSVTLPWIDSFELGSDAAIAARYASGSCSRGSSAPRTGQYGIPANLKQAFANQATVVTGAGWLMSANGVDLLSLQDGASTQIKIRFNGDNTLSVVRGDGTVLATSDPSTQQFLTNPYWPYLEFKATIHNTAGAFELWVNETLWLSATGVNTRFTANDYANGVSIGVGGNAHVDDFYIDDGSRGLWGNQKMEYLPVNGDGTYTQLSRGGADSGSNHGQVDESAQNGDTDYVKATAVGQKDTYTLTPMSGAPLDVTCLQLTMVARKEDILDREVAFLLKSGATEDLGANLSLDTSYGHFIKPYVLDPHTGSPWAYAGVNAAEIGVEATV